MGILILFLLGGFLVYYFATGASKVADAAVNKGKNEVTYTGKIISLTTEKSALYKTMATDRIILELTDGSRLQLRNVRAEPTGILLTVGDTGEFKVRGDMIWGFTRAQ